MRSIVVRRVAATSSVLVASLALTTPVLASPGDNGPFAVTLHARAEDGRQAEPQVWTMNVDGSGLHRQFAALEESNQNPVWSPDGEWLAFNRGGAVVVARPDGSGSRIVTQGVYSKVTWSPDGSRLAFGRWAPHGRGSINIVGADGTDEHEVSCEA